eukprot:6180988-Pleurochrysis_carterae.AAC.4
MKDVSIFGDFRDLMLTASLMVYFWLLRRTMPCVAQLVGDRATESGSTNGCAGLKRQQNTYPRASSSSARSAASATVTACDKVLEIQQVGRSRVFPLVSSFADTYWASTRPAGSPNGQNQSTPLHFKTTTSFSLSRRRSIHHA